MQDEGIQRLYYSISEICEITGLEAHVLRYWETEFPELAPRKNRAGHRIYTERDLTTIQRIKTLLKEDKYTIEGARRVLERDLDEETWVHVRRRDLEAIRELLSDLRGRIG
jgi:DNA-binding transcriptional MerR regulator